MKFSELDRDLLLSELWCFREYASCGNDLIGLGEVIQYLEYFDEDSDDEVDIFVTLSLGYRVSDGGYEEGIFADITIGPEGLVFEELRTSYAASVGSDHYTEEHARFDSMASFRHSEIQEWSRIVDRIRESGRARLRADRNHV
jgi:hypothetical protein